MLQKTRSAKTYIEKYISTSLPNKFSLDQYVKSEIDHIPVGSARILHGIQCQGHMRMAVITENIMLNVQNYSNRMGNSQNDTYIHQKRL